MALRSASAARSLSQQFRALCTALPAAQESVSDVTSRVYATGKRKSSVGRVWIEPSTEGGIKVNGVSLKEYCSGLGYNRAVVMEPLVATGTVDSIAVKSTVKGGGTSGQVGALRLGISRALIKMSPDLRPILRKAGLLTRDSRVVERKKPGQKKARKKFQWVKR